MNPVIDLAKDLISCASVTPEDAGCQALMQSRLQPLGFRSQSLIFADVTNLWTVHGDTGPLLVFAGHTDVVPTGPLEEWHTPPFEPTLIEGRLAGRGAADMKGSLAAMVIAAEAFVSEHPQHSGRLALLITSDEEGPAEHGTKAVIDHLRTAGEKIDWCVVGEPSSSNRLGDVIKNGRRGSLGGVLKVKGIQGHVAYPDKARNPIHQALAALDELVQTRWDEGNEFFPATSFQISNIHAGTGATNVIPGSLEVVFNFRFSTETTDQALMASVERILDAYKLDYSLDWSLSGQPFLTEPGELVKATQDSLLQHCGYQAELSTSGGTSDGRFIAPTGAQVIELGPCNATIHQVNEWVSADDLALLARVYQGIMERLLCD